jgi:hypothetical protein
VELLQGCNDSFINWRQLLQIMAHALTELSAHSSDSSGTAASTWQVHQLASSQQGKGGWWQAGGRLVAGWWRLLTPCEGNVAHLM